MMRFINACQLVALFAAMPSLVRWLVEKNTAWSWWCAACVTIVFIIAFWFFVALVADRDLKTRP